MNVSKKVLVVALLASVAFSGVSFAAENKENSLTGFLRNLFNYPARATSETAGVVANTANNTGETLSHAGESTNEILHGNVAETGTLAADAVIDTANTVGQTAAETVTAPIEAAQPAEVAQA